jgi:predicted ester cyclase
MSSEYLHRAGRRLVLEVFNAGSLEMLDALVAPDFVDHALPEDVPPNRDGLKSMIAAFRQAFPDLEYTIEDQVAEGDKLAQRLVGRGTLKGEFMGMAPTGRTAVWQEMHIHRFDTNGLLVEHWDITDSMGMLVQLGLGNPAGAD